MGAVGSLTGAGIPSAVIAGVAGFIGGYALGTVLEKSEDTVEKYEEITSKLVECAASSDCSENIDEMVKERQNAFIDVLKTSQEAATKMNKPLSSYLLESGVSSLSGGMKLLIDSGIISINPENVITEILNGQVPRSLIGFDIDMLDKK